MYLVTAQYAVNSPIAAFRVCLRRLVLLLAVEIDTHVTPVIPRPACVRLVTPDLSEIAQRLSCGFIRDAALRNNFYRDVWVKVRC